MAVVAHNEKEVDLLARLIRAEAEGDGELGMLMVGNTGVNRVISDCLDFTSIRNINDVVFQSPGGCEAKQKGCFNHRAREVGQRLARRIVDAARCHPSPDSPYFCLLQRHCPAQWYTQSDFEHS